MIALVVSAALLGAVQMPSESCPSGEVYWIEQDAPPAERVGAGLWIGGEPFPPEDFISATAVTDDLDRPAIAVRLTATGVERFRAVQRCRLSRQIEISFDGRVVSRPMLSEYILGDAFELTGPRDMASAKEIAAKIKP